MLGCTCMDVGCWPLYATVEVKEDRVVWRDFGNPFCGPEFYEDKPEMHWQYKGLGPFVFDRGQYMRALERPRDLK